MSSLVSWTGVDSHDPASIYIATDSRISWENGGHWDSGRKVFASRSRPENFGYVGDVLFPSLVLGQISDTIESPDPERLPSPEARFAEINALIQEAFATLPKGERREFKIAYAQREGQGSACRFRFFSLEWAPETGWFSSEKRLPTVSDTIVVWGSGTEAVSLWKQRWDESSQRSTSRSVFSSFVDAIRSGKDARSGGAPQVVRLYRKGPARPVGTIHQGHAYIFGLRASPGNHTADDFEWRNHLFERCNVRGDLVAFAKRHHAPRGLGGNVADH
jgi:hypothetical protein